jgi:broad specificity phosphatase PhoE
MPSSETAPTGDLVVVRHGDTEWSQSGQHTSRTDLPLLPDGRRRAQQLGEVLADEEFQRVLCSPLRRARETCEVAGFGDRAEILDDLREWDYGDYEGLTTSQIREQRPYWLLWRDGCPAGESPEQIGARADRVIAHMDGRRTIAFAHGHILRVLAARWIGLGVEGGSRLVLSPARLGWFGYDHEDRALRRWNGTELGE